mmetsp:Transcript_5986/g.14485  ORF Transcript_5986/g.14485 Transcript_5986/m.14485 type:complete len:162 (+) Transcript_5986:851-1336(+)
MLGSGGATPGMPSELEGLRVASGVIGETLPPFGIVEFGGEPEGEGEGEGERDERGCVCGRIPPPRRELESTAAAIPSATRATAIAHRPSISVCWTIETDRWTTCKACSAATAWCWTAVLATSCAGGGAYVGVWAEPGSSRPCPWPCPGPSACAGTTPWLPW